ncbi:MAG: ABC transporter ATP-binding protein [Defluviitaleaceae bacterium]|nr:ABC transporter ATP-binding protein [Defluviitaleaceae bacterium]
MNNDYRIEVRNLSVIYKNLIPITENFQALKDVSLTLEPGRIYGLLGRNGAGKTSLLSVLSAFRKASSGDVLINGTPLFDNGALMQHIQFIYQKKFDTESGETYPKIRKYIKKETAYRPYFDLDYADELIQKFGLPTNKRPHKLSKGMQSVLSVIIGLASRAPVTIFDEAYLGMDAPTRDLFYKEVLKDQARHPRIMVMSTHLVSEMEYLFDEVIMIHQGELIKKGTYDELVAAGMAITGRADVVDQFAVGKDIINIESLGGFKKITLFGDISEEDHLLAQALALEVSAVTLQDLFIHLTT